MAKNLKRKWFPIYLDFPGSDAARVRDYAAGYCSCRMNVARFFNLENDTAGNERWFKKVEGKVDIDTTIMDGTGAVALNQSTADSDNKKADYDYVYRKIARGKSAVMTTGTVNKNKRLKTVSFLFPKSIPNGLIARALCIILPANKIDRTGTVSTNNVSPDFRLGSSSYTIPLAANLGTLTSGDLKVANTSGNIPTSLNPLLSSVLNKE